MHQIFTGSASILGDEQVTIQVGVYEEIDTEIEKTGKGVKVTQTSSDAAVVNLL